MTEETESFMRETGVVGLIADKTEDSPEIDRLMLELGHSSLGIPLYAIYPGDGRPPIVFKGLLTKAGLLDRLKTAGPLLLSLTISHIAAKNGHRSINADAANRISSPRFRTLKRLIRASLSANSLNVNVPAIDLDRPGCIR